MYITDITFLFIFLPAMLIATALQPKWKMYALLLLSLFFYACGSPVYFMLFLAGTIVNVLLAYVVQTFRTRSYILAKSALILGILLNAGCLFYYKYFDFVRENVNALFGTAFAVKGLLLPLGISFFVFKAISLLTDVFFGRVELKQNPVYAALYLSFFAQAISGPICRNRVPAAKNPQKSADLPVCGLQKAGQERSVILPKQHIVITAVKGKE